MAVGHSKKQIADDLKMPWKSGDKTKLQLAPELVRGSRNSQE